MFDNPFITHKNTKYVSTDNTDFDNFSELYKLIENYKPFQPNHIYPSFSDKWETHTTKENDKTIIKVAMPYIQKDDIQARLISDGILITAKKPQSQEHTFAKYGEQIIKIPDLVIENLTFSEGILRIELVPAENKNKLDIN